MALLGLSQEQIGRYGAATTVTWGLLALPQVIALAVYPELSRRASTRASSLAPALAAGAAGLGLGAALAVLLVTLRAPLVRLVFGSRFAASADLLEILGWALPGACASMILGVVVAAWHAQRWAFVWLAVTVLLAATLDLLWIPRFGAVGAARGALVAHSVGAVGYVALACAAGRLVGRSDG
jgi:O-antigen/teichoic acid export membrane protein